MGRRRVYTCERCARQYTHGRCARWFKSVKFCSQRCLSSALRAKSVKPVDSLELPASIQSQIEWLKMVERERV